MNLAVSALGIFLLVLPGVIFRRTFLRGLRGFPVAPRALPDEVAISAVAAAPLHGVWGWLVQKASSGFGSGSPEIDVEAAARLATGTFGDDHAFSLVIASIAEHACAIVLYFLGLYAFAAIGGVVAHLLAARSEWLRNGWFFGFNSRWHHLIDGELYFEGTRTKPDGLVYCIVSAIVEVGTDAYIYQGLVLDASDLTFDSAGNLEELTLRGARRRKLSDEQIGESVEAKAARFYPIRGDLFVLRYAHAKTVNFNYVALSPVAATETADHPEA